MPQPAWRRRTLALLVVVAVAGSGCARTGRFNVGNARAHVERLAGAIGPRPAGTAANGKARAYLIETLQLYGFDVRVQEADATWPDAGRNTRVSNIVAVQTGQERDAVALVAHYDSVPHGPGAGDDAFGVAVVLEAARVLAARSSPRYTLMVLLTDGEEHGLMGARALAQDPEVRARLKAFVNLEAIGAAGPVVLFEAGPGTSPALRAWSAAARPRGGSYMQSIYDALPNDTDFTILSAIPGASGINLAAVGDGYAYHTDRDRADRVTSEALARTGETVLDVVDGVDARPTLEAAPARSMYFSVLDRTAFLMSMGTGVALGGLFSLLGATVWLLIARRLVRAGGWPRVVMTLAWATIAAGAVLGALVAAVWLIRGARAQLHPWFASPMALFAFMTVMVVAISWVVRRLAAMAPLRLQPDGTPMGVWFTALPVWVVLSTLALLYAPAASYLAWVPLASAVLLLPLALWRPAAARPASAVVFLVTWVLWIPDILTLLPFAVTALGRFPIVTPTWAFPALLFAAGVVLWPPVLATVVGRLRWRVRHGLAGAALMIALAATGALALTSSAYTAERPLQRVATFIDDRVRGTAHWELSSNEPGVDIAAGAPPNIQWRPVAGEALSSRIGAPVKAHVFRGDVSVPTAALPFTVTATVIRRPGDADIEVTVTPADDEWTELAIVLPEDMVPTRTTLVGRSRNGRWQARYTTLTRAGLTWRATVPAAQADRLAAVEVQVSSTQLPGHTPGSPLPAWLQTPRTTWHTRHTIATGITPSDVAQPTAPELGASVYASSSLGKLHYFDRGEGPQALVFLHGWGGNSAFWREQVAIAPARALFIDLPGHGRSESPDATYDTAGIAAAVSAVLEAAGVQQAVLVGHNVGALVAWHVAVRQPARVVGLVAVDGTLLPPAGQAPETHAYLKSLPPSGHEALVTASIPTLFTPTTPQPLRDEVTASIRRTPARVIAGIIQDVGAGSPYAPGAYPGPVLALATTASHATGQEAALRERFAQLDYRVLESGHFPMLERPAEVNDAIAGFLLGRGLLR